jgi:hypothetical protein
VLFKREFHARLRDGSITLTFRRWSRPQVKVGGRYRYPFGELEVDRLDQVAVSKITGSEARRSGFEDVAGLRAALARGAKPLRGSDRIYRIAFHFAGKPAARQIDTSGGLDPGEIEDLWTRTQRMDARSADGAWTRRTLALIEKHPQTAASRLAPRLGRETAPFKADVRKLKRLGLTRSFEVGYELTARAREFLARTRRRRR